MGPDVIAHLIEAAERYYDSTFDLNEAEKAHREVEQSANANPHDIAYALCKLWSQKGESLRAAGSLLHAVEAYRAKEKTGSL
jgi:hypothetical protein